MGACKDYNKFEKESFYFERLQKALFTDKMVAPISVEIDLTNICHQACYYCNSVIYRAHNPDVATTEDYLRLLDQLPTDTHDITFAGGGEPLDHPDASKIMNYALRKGFKIGIITNGMGIRKLDFTKDYHPDWIGVDFDSADPEQYFKIRRGNLKKTISSVKTKLNEWKEHGTWWTFKYLINDYNNDPESIKKACELAAKLGFQEFFMRIVYFDTKTEKIPELQGLAGGKYGDGLPAWGKKTKGSDRFKGSGIRTLQPPEGWTWRELEAYTNKICKDLGLEYKQNLGKQEHFAEVLGRGSKPVGQCFSPLFFPLFTSVGKILWCCEHRGSDSEKEYTVGNWIKDGLDPLFDPKMVDKMTNFIKYHKCAIQCRYYKQNQFMTHLDKGEITQEQLIENKNNLTKQLEEHGDKTGHRAGFF